MIKRLLTKFNHYFSSIRFKLLLSYMIISVASILIMGVVIYNVCTNIIQQKVSESTLDQLNKVNAVIEQRITIVQNFIESFVSNSQVNNILSKEFTEYKYKDVNTIISIIESGMKPTALITSVIIYTNNGHLYKAGDAAYMSADDIVNSEWYDKVSYNKKREKFYWLGTQKSYGTRMNNGLQLAVASKLNTFLNEDKFGIIYIGLSPDDIYPMDNVAGDFFVVDESMEILVHMNEKRIGTTFDEIETPDQLLQNEEGYFIEEINHEKYLLVYSTSKPTGWKIIQKIPFDAISVEIKTFQGVSLIIILSLTVGVFMVSFILSKMISQPIKKLILVTKEVEKGNLDTRVNISGKDEIGKLGRSFNRMITNLRELIQTIYEQEQKKKEVEIGVLQAQIDPHFLYNTLETIRWMSVVHNVQSINDMIASLTKFLKIRLSSSRTLITLKEEIDSLEQYIYILNVRYNNGISFEYDLPKELENYQIIRFLLQPLVENAIVHGIKPCGGVGEIRVDCFIKDSNLKIVISDDGIGIDMERIDSIFNQDDGKENQKKSIGIINVIERIKLHYGEQYGLSIESIKGQGTKVIITTPKED